MYTPPLLLRSTFTPPNCHVNVIVGSMMMSQGRETEELTMVAMAMLALTNSGGAGKRAHGECD